MFKPSYFSYLLATLLLIGFYAISLQVLVEERGFRLPLYYSLDGTVLPMSNSSDLAVGTRIRSIDGQLPTVFSPVFAKNKKVIIITKTGPQWLKSIPNSLRTIFFDFKYLIIASFIFVFCGLWFYHNTRDIHLVAFNIFLGTFCASLVSTLAEHNFVFLWQLSSLCVISAILNMGLRTTGRRIYTYLIIGEINFILFFALLYYVGRQSPVTIHKLHLFLLIICSIIIIFVLIVQFHRTWQKRNDPEERLKRWILFLGTFFFIFLNFLFFILTLLTWFPKPALIYSAISISAFPITLIYGTYRLQIIPFQIILSKSLIIFLQATFFSCIYGIAVLLKNFFIPQQENELQWIIHIAFLITLIFFLDPLQYFFSSRLRKEKFWRDEKLEQSLQKLASIITSHRRIQTAVDNLIEEVRLTLDLKKVDLLLSDNIFQGLHLRSGKLHRIPYNSHYWKYLQNNQIVITDYLTYGGGVREELFHFLFRENYMLALGIQGAKAYTRSLSSILASYKISKGNKKHAQHKDDEVGNLKAALLIGYRKGDKSLKVIETRYLHEATRLVNTLMQNYTILIAEIEKRKRIRKLQIASQLQRKLPEIEKEKIKNINFAYSSQPAVSVTGDYFDLFPIKTHHIACVLGDVSGHGLGTGYLASSLQAIIRSHLQGGASLSETAKIVNRFFLEHYQGDEFLTLVGFILDTKKNEIEYLNAAHPSPYLLQANSDKLIYLKSFQSVMGILPTQYKTEKLKVSPKDRLFLYSDGASETFNLQHVPFGEKRLAAFIEKHRNTPLPEILPKLETELLNFREKAELTDDTTMAILEIGGHGLLSVKQAIEASGIHKLIPFLKTEN